MRLHNIIHPRAVTEFVYRYARAEVAHVLISFILDTSSREKEVAQILRELEKEGMKGNDISDDELGKAHGRYLVGGCQVVEDERVFRFGKCGHSNVHSGIHTLIGSGRIPRETGSASTVSARAALRLEYLAVSLSESRRRFVVARCTYCGKGHVNTDYDCRRWQGAGRNSGST